MNGSHSPNQGAKKIVMEKRSKREGKTIPRLKFPSYYTETMKNLRVKHY